MSASPSLTSTSSPSTKPRRPAAPAGLAKGGKRLWRETVALYELSPPEARILEEACRTVDVLDRLREIGRGDRIVREVRMQSELLRKLLSSLNFPDEEPHEAVPQSRSTAARMLAHQRWRKRG